MHCDYYFVQILPSRLPVLVVLENLRVPEVPVDLYHPAVLVHLVLLAVLVDQQVMVLLVALVACNRVQILGTMDRHFQ
jgi:hypothetical protein